MTNRILKHCILSKTFSLDLPDTLGIRVRLNLINIKFTPISLLNLLTYE